VSKVCVKEVCVSNACIREVCVSNFRQLAGIREMCVSNLRPRETCVSVKFAPVGRASFDCCTFIVRCVRASLSLSRSRSLSLSLARALSLSLPRSLALALCNYRTLARCSRRYQSTLALLVLILVHKYSHTLLN